MLDGFMSKESIKLDPTSLDTLLTTEMYLYSLRHIAQQ